MSRYSHKITWCKYLISFTHILCLTKKQFNLIKIYEGRPYFYTSFAVVDINIEIFSAPEF